MENGGGGGGGVHWKFSPQKALVNPPAVSVRSVLDEIRAKLNESDDRPLIHLGIGDPSGFPSFQTSPEAVDAIISALRSAKFNCYAPSVGVSSARSAVAAHLSEDLPYELSQDSVFLTSGCAHAIEIVLSVLSRPGANILLPRPGYPFYEARCAYNGLEIRHFDLDADREWEIDLDMVCDLADENTVAMVVINPSNPCGNVLSYQHLSKVAETAKKLGIMVIADEVYGHLAFGKNPFVQMGAFGETVPVLTLGGLSKRWVVPGWRLGWIAVTDPNGVLRNTKIIKGIKNYLNISTDSATFVQGALPDILKNTKGDFFAKKIESLRKSCNLCYKKLSEIDCISCPHKPEGSMVMMVKLDVSCFDGICDDVSFCCMLAKEESVIILPGTAVGLKNWLRITFAVECSALNDGLDRLKSFCERHRKRGSLNQNGHLRVKARAN